MAEPIEHVEFFVEERSMEAALAALVPKIRADLTFNLLQFAGKDGLLARLPDLFRGYRSFLPPSWRIVVVVDQDDDDCLALKRRIEGTARAAGLKPKSARNQAFDVVTRIAIEELEAWFFGDADAIASAYPGVPSTLANKKPYRQPDEIAGGTWEALHRVLRNAGYYPAALPKTEVARTIAAHMVPARNRSPSFCAFRDVVASF